MGGPNNGFALIIGANVIEEAGRALQKFGAGMGTSAAASGVTDLHIAFERAFAALVGKPAACLFPTGYTANLGTVAGLLDHDDVVVLDQLCHASIVDGARLCGATVRTFQHNRASDLEAVLETVASPYRTVLVVLEGVYSMGEGAAPIEDIVRTAKKFNALVLVDEAHSFGFYGPRGAGICAARGITDDADFIMTTLSKALGSLGGVVAGSEAHIALLKSSSRAYIFQASISPADIAAALAALHRLSTDETLQQRLWDTTQYMRTRFSEAGYDLGTGDGPIVTPHFSDRDKLFALVEGLYKRGIHTTPVTYPIVEAGRGRLRFICSASHTREDVDQTLRALVAAETEFDASIRTAQDASPATALDRIRLQAWVDGFSSYLEQIVDTFHPDLKVCVSVKTSSNDEFASIGLARRKITTDAPDEDTPSCALSFSSGAAAEDLANSGVEALLASIISGTCALEGQIEPFIWFMARVIDWERSRNSQIGVMGNESLSVG
ncbi:MAG: aminotransferase class I/II-fold pyridoxal phosphate-dependent enzyme [Myxococcota bacterium]